MNHCKENKPYNQVEKEEHEVYRKHLSPEERAWLQLLLEQGEPLASAARYLGRNLSTVCKEIKRYRIHRSVKHPCSLSCACRLTGVCGDAYCTRPCNLCKLKRCSDFCERFCVANCPTVVNAPYVCNACEKYKHCRMDKYLYDAVIAQAKANDKKSLARSHKVLSDAQLRALDDLISPLILRGQSLSAIYWNHLSEIPVSLRTLYSWLSLGYFTAKPLDLRQMVSRKPRKALAKNQEQSPTPNYRQGRSYEDFLSFTQRHPELDVTEMDTVLGTKEGAAQTLFTLCPRRSGLLLIQLLKYNRQSEVIAALDALEQRIGQLKFKETFPILLTDNGSEFKNVTQIERSVFGGRRCFLFFCHPYASWEKPNVEQAHRLIRYVLPKGISFAFLNHGHIRILNAHINSYPRLSKARKAPLDQVAQLPHKNVLEYFSLRRIPCDEVNLTPNLLK